MNLQIKCPTTSRNPRLDYSSAPQARYTWDEDSFEVATDDKEHQRLEVTCPFCKQALVVETHPKQGFFGRFSCELKLGLNALMKECIGILPAYEGGKMHVTHYWLTDKGEKVIPHDVYLKDGRVVFGSSLIRKCKKHGGYYADDMCCPICGQKGKEWYA